jgi:hypothetical protein
MWTERRTSSLLLALSGIEPVFQIPSNFVKFVIACVTGECKPWTSQSNDWACVTSCLCGDCCSHNPCCRLSVISMGCLQRLSVALVTILTTCLVNGEGILYPTESESRDIRSLDGIWAFRLANESDSSVGHREGWYKQELRKVSSPLLLFSNSILKYLCAC